MSREWDPIAVPKSMWEEWDMGIPFPVERIKDDCADIVGELFDDDERLFNSWLQRCSTRNWNAQGTRSGGDSLIRR